MTIAPGDTDTALAPVRAAVLRAARADAERVLKQVRDEVRAEWDRGQAEASDITERAAATGRARAAEQLAIARRAAARSERALELAARRRAYDRWRAAATAAVLELRTAPDYPDLRNLMRNAVSRLLGPDAVIVEDADGGLVATADGRLLDLRLGTVAARALDRLEPEAAGAWA